MPPAFTDVCATLPTALLTVQETGCVSVHVTAGFPELARIQSAEIGSVVVALYCCCLMILPPYLSPALPTLPPVFPFSLSVFFPLSLPPLHSFSLPSLMPTLFPLIVSLLFFYPGPSLFLLLISFPPSFLYSVILSFLPPLLPALPPPPLLPLLLSILQTFDRRYIIIKIWLFAWMEEAISGSIILC